ncbi:alpha/beta hydrolase [Burkholderia sp. BCC0405]|uniref:alpha/beta fold hydrolase n=1 Tax=Burkholderia sp. BCC0405 TaxID=2676298 RepID=UPI00158B0590|nr:alpha/beta hydrolase [Burkholderia sp. BCC0405]
MRLVSYEKLSGFGSVADAPNLSAAFRQCFGSYRIHANGIAQHAVIGGEGPPLLLLSGWPQSWFMWRYLMMRLAREYTVIAADPRGVGLSDIPADGYDSETLSADLLALMSELGHERFAMAGHDIGMWTGWAMAADAPRRITRIALGEALIPGTAPSPPLISDDRRPSDRLWHFNFNRAYEINEALVVGREDIYFGHQFSSKAAHPEAVPRYARDYYVEQLRRVPGALKASFDYYRAIDQSIPQNRRRMTAKLAMPVLAFAGALSIGKRIEQQLMPLANDVTVLVIDDCGHYPAEEQPDQLLSAFLEFFRPWRGE